MKAFFKRVFSFLLKFLWHTKVDTDFTDNKEDDLTTIVNVEINLGGCQDDTNSSKSSKDKRRS